MSILLTDATRTYRFDVRQFRRIMATADRDHPNHYFTIVDFDSFDSAMENSGRPETSEFAARMAELCDGPVTFHNLDVLWQDTGEGADNA